MRNFGSTFTHGSLKAPRSSSSRRRLAGAQDFRAKLTVTVTDPSGTAVPAAAVELTMPSTAELASAKTNDTGGLQAFSSCSRRYKLKVFGRRFKPAAREKLCAPVLPSQRIDVKLKLAESPTASP